jgi:hypothetical protein
MEAVNQEIYSVNKRLIAKIYCLTDELESTKKRKSHAEKRQAIFINCVVYFGGQLFC